jgi:hypothetical protein
VSIKRHLRGDSSSKKTQVQVFDVINEALELARPRHEFKLNGRRKSIATKSGFFQMVVTSDLRERAPSSLSDDLFDLCTHSNVELSGSIFTSL